MTFRINDDGGTLLQNGRLAVRCLGGGPSGIILRMVDEARGLVVVKFRTVGERVMHVEELEPLGAREAAIVMARTVQ